MMISNLVNRIDAAAWRLTRRLALWAARKVVDAADRRLRAAEKSLAVSQDSCGVLASTNARGIRATPVKSPGKRPAAKARKTVTAPAAAAVLAERLLKSGLTAMEASSALENMGYTAPEAAAAVTQIDTQLSRRGTFKVSMGDIAQALEA